MATFEDFKALATQLAESYASRNTMFQEMERMYLLEDSDLPNGDWIKDTISPDARNRVVGGVRLLTAADPAWSVPSDANSPSTAKISSTIEKAAAAIWAGASNAYGRPLAHDIALSALLYAELDMPVISVADQLEAAKTPVEKKRIEAVYKTTPVLFDVVNPAIAYPYFDNLGLRAYYSKQELTIGQVRGLWGESVLQNRKAFDKVNYHDLWDLEYHAVWVDGEDSPLLFEPHQLTMIPVASGIVEGSKLFFRPNQQTRQPLLYGLWKSGLWKRQNLALTLMNSLAFSIGSNPLYVYKRNEARKKAPERDFSQPGGTIMLDPGEDYQALAKQIIDPSIVQIFQTAQQLSEESTLYSTALGQSIGSDAPFSMVALLNQAGRLPLVPYQRMASFVISQAMMIAFKMLKQTGKPLKLKGADGEQIELDVKNIPDDLVLVATLDISMPQDDRQMVAVALQATSGQEPLVSKRWAREKWLKIGQSDDMDYEISSERMYWVQHQVEQQALAQKLLMEQQQAQQAQPPAAPGMPGDAGQGAPMQGPPMAGGPMQGAMPPELAAQMQGQLQSTGAEPGLPGMMAGAPVHPGGFGGEGGF